jgi:phenylalanyl-tRNA synthetase beta chain
MKISYNWLKQYIDLTESPEDLAKKLTFAGLEVEDITAREAVPGGLAGVVIGEVLTCAKHPNADKLSLTTVAVGADNPLKIVCGAPNVAAGQKVLVATIGTTLYPAEGEPFQIKKSKIRGEESEGMICAEDELGLGNSHAGIMVLTTDLPNGTPAAQYFNFETDYIFEIGLTPNRADAASHWGVARDLRVLLDKSISKPNIDSFKPDNQSLSVPVTVENLGACPRYSGVVIKNLQVKESPDWLKNRLLSIGLRPINNVVDITNFVLHELGQPLHAFDVDKIGGKAIKVKTLPQDTPFVSLDGLTRKLSERDLMICDANDAPMCIGGVFGGSNSGVSEQTTAIFLESACFSPDYIRKSEQYHGLKTDASFRFARGTDPNGTVFALQRAALLIQEVAGGEIASEIIDIYPSPIPAFEVPVLYYHIDRLIGKKLAKDLIKKILTQLEIEILNETAEGFLAKVPPYRVDVQREADIIEEIARLYGYENIEFGETLGASYLADFPEVDANKIQFKITQMLAANGFSEMLNNSLTKPTYIELVKSLDATQNVEILNKLSEELAVMRQTLLFSGLEVLAYNLNRKQKDLKFFEFGKIYKYTPPSPPLSGGENDNAPLVKGGTGGVSAYLEKMRLSIFLVGNQKAETWREKSKAGEFHDLATAVMKVLQKMNITEVKTEAWQDDIYQYGAIYKLKNREIARLGSVQKTILKAFNIKTEVFYADLDWEFLLNRYSDAIQYDEVSKFPEVRRDLSLILEKTVSFQQIKDLAYQKERKLLKSINVFDVFEGESLGGKKSYSISFMLEDKTATLTDEAIDRVMQKLMQAYETELGAVIRK